MPSVVLEECLWGLQWHLVSIHLYCLNEHLSVHWEVVLRAIATEVLVTLHLIHVILVHNTKLIINDSQVLQPVRAGHDEIHHVTHLLLRLLHGTNLCLDILKCHHLSLPHGLSVLFTLIHRRHIGLVVPMVLLQLHQLSLEQ